MNLKIYEQTLSKCPLLSYYGRHFTHILPLRQGFFFKKNIFELWSKLAFPPFFLLPLPPHQPASSSSASQHQSDRVLAEVEVPVASQQQQQQLKQQHKQQYDVLSSPFRHRMDSTTTTSEGGGTTEDYSTDEDSTRYGRRATSV